MTRLLYWFSHEIVAVLVVGLLWLASTLVAWLAPPSWKDQ